MAWGNVESYPATRLGLEGVRRPKDVLRHCHPVVCRDWGLGEAVLKGPATLGLPPFASVLSL